jgi:hypothetical protein
VRKSSWVSLSVRRPFFLLDLPEVGHQLVSLVGTGQGFADDASGVRCLDIYLGICRIFQKRGGRVLGEEGKGKFEGKRLILGKVLCLRCGDAVSWEAMTAI